MEEDKVKKLVREGYAKVASENQSCCSMDKSCCGATPPEQIGYSNEELDGVPAGADLGLGCGNPTALAELKEGETVLDLGSGPGLDCFIAAKKVGTNGKVIGVDMTPEMIDRARHNAKEGAYENVEFRLGEIENLPVADNSADIVISNCVINLSTNKGQVFAEAFRTLKPGGRLMVSDIVLKEELPQAIMASAAAYISCLAGAIMRDDYVKAITDAGFHDVKILKETNFSIDLMCNDPTVQNVIKDLGLSSAEVKELDGSVVSVLVFALKP